MWIVLSFFFTRSQAGRRIMVRSDGGVFIVDLAIVSRSLVRGKEALVGAEIFESVEWRGGIIMCLFLWCLMCRS